MITIHDEEFGDITVRRYATSRSVRIKTGTDGRLMVSAPTLVPLFLIKRSIEASRVDLRKHLSDATPPIIYTDGHVVGKSHSIALVNTGMVKQPTIQTKGQKILVLLPENSSITDPAIQRDIRDSVIKALRVEAKAYLPRRLKSLAQENGFYYDKVRFSHAISRWGSCSSSGTISLNIALMKLPHELIDYVLIHELSHTRHMDHSPAFWKEVEQYDPHYRLHRRQIKRETPTV
ncbi:MAG: SprT family zinc-dependent metalloprotease [Candidatus Saccharimonas sp.]